MNVQSLPSMSLKESIKACVTKYATFSGRARRSEYWFFNIFAMMIMWALIILSILTIVFSFKDSSGYSYYYDHNGNKIRYHYNNINNGFSHIIILILLIILLLIMLVPIISSTIRRLHDIGKSGAYILLSFIPFGDIVLFIFLIEDSQQTMNQYGPSPKYISMPNSSLIDGAQNIMVSGIPNPNSQYVQQYQQQNLHPSQYLQYPEYSKNSQIEIQPNLYEGPEPKVLEPSNREQIATPMVSP